MSERKTGERKYLCVRRGAESWILMKPQMLLSWKTYWYQRCSRTLLTRFIQEQVDQNCFIFYNRRQFPELPVNQLINPLKWSETSLGCMRSAWYEHVWWSDTHKHTQFRATSLTPSPRFPLIRLRTASDEVEAHALHRGTHTHTHEYANKLHCLFGIPSSHLSTTEDLTSFKPPHDSVAKATGTENRRSCGIAVKQ